MKGAMVTQAGESRFTWQLQDAKNRLSEVVRRAMTAGPQTITLRGKPTAVVISYQQFKQTQEPRTPLIRFLAASPLKGVVLDLQREESV
jgi:antitoxin Phd